MSIKRAVLLFPFLLVVSCSVWASSVFGSLKSSSGVDFVRISDSSSIQLSREISFKAGFRVSDNTAFFASAGFRFSSQKISFNAFRSPGDVSFSALRLGVIKKVHDCNLAAGAGLDLMFATSYVKRMLLLLGISLEAVLPVIVSESFVLCAVPDVSMSFAKNLMRISVGIGVSVSGTGI